MSVGTRENFVNLSQRVCKRCRVKQNSLQGIEDDGSERDTMVRIVLLRRVSVRVSCSIMVHGSDGDLDL